MCYQMVATSKLRESVMRKVPTILIGSAAVVAVVAVGLAMATHNPDGRGSSNSSSVEMSVRKTPASKVCNAQVGDFEVVATNLEGKNQPFYLAIKKGGGGPLASTASTSDMSSDGSGKAISIKFPCPRYTGDYGYTAELYQLGRMIASVHFSISKDGTEVKLK